MRTILVVLTAAATVLACERSGDPVEREAPEPGPPPEVPTPPDPRAFDTVSVIEEARALERETDAAIDDLTRRERTVDPPAPNGERRRIVLWERDGLPVRLEVTEPDDAGRMTAISTYDFDGRTRLRQARHPHAAYILSPEGELMVWMDEDGEVLHDIPQEDRRARAATLEQEAREYVEEFLVGRD